METRIIKLLKEDKLELTTKGKKSLSKAFKKKKMKITEKQAKDYFVKLNCDTNNKEELAEEIWKRMDTSERDRYFRELE